MIRQQKSNAWYYQDAKTRFRKYYEQLSYTQLQGFNLLDHIKFLPHQQIEIDKILQESKRIAQGEMGIQGLSFRGIQVGKFKDHIQPLAILYSNIKCVDFRNQTFIFRQTIAQYLDERFSKETYSQLKGEWRHLFIDALIIDRKVRGFQSPRESCFILAKTSERIMKNQVVQSTYFTRCYSDIQQILYWEGIDIEKDMDKEGREYNQFYHLFELKDVGYYKFYFWFFRSCQGYCSLLLLPFQTFKVIQMYKTQKQNRLGGHSRKLKVYVLQSLHYQKQSIEGQVKSWMPVQQFPQENNEQKGQKYHKQISNKYNKDKQNNFQVFKVIFDGQSSKLWINSQLEFFSAEISYFIVYFNYNPYILTYKNDNIKIGQLIKQLPFSSRQICLTLSNGVSLSSEMSVAILKKRLRSHRIQGFHLFAKRNSEISEKVDKQSFLYPSLAERKSQFSEKVDKKNYFLKVPKFEDPIYQELYFELIININIPNTDKYFTYNVRPIDLLQGIFNKFYADVKVKFNIELTNEMIHKILVSSNQEDRSQVCLEKLSQSIQSIDEICHGVFIYLQLKQVQKFLKQIKDERIIRIYKENSEQYFEEVYEKVQLMVFKTLYQTRIVPMGDYGMVRGLLVLDEIVTEYDRLSKIAHFYDIAQMRLKVLVGRVINQKIILYKSIASFKEEINLDDFIFPFSGQYSESFIQGINQKLAQYFSKNQLIFSSVNKIKPIYLYTANKIYCYSDLRNKKINQKQQLFVLINQFLRYSNIFVLANHLFQKWQFQFVTKLSLTLEQFHTRSKKSSETTVYRGINYDLKGKTGEIVTFPSFLSTSTSKAVAQRFLLKSLSTSTTPTLLKMRIKKRKSVRDYSAFPDQEQVILQPYTQFRIIELDEYQLNNRNVQQIKLQELDQRQSTKSFPETFINIIIWVDDNAFEGKYDYEKANFFKENTFLKQLASTQDLYSWLHQKKNQYLLSAKTTNVVFITDMRRQDDPIAGVKGIKQLQKYFGQRQVPTLVYVRNKEYAHQNLMKHRNQIKNVEKIEFANQKQELEQFLKRALRIKKNEPDSCQLI